MIYGFVFLAIFLTVYGQIAIKWQVLQAGSFPADNHERLVFLAKLIFHPWVLSALAAAFLAALAWMVAMTRLPLSHAYPFMSLAFILVTVCSAYFFNEPVTPLKVGGMALICAGIVVGSQG